MSEIEGAYALHPSLREDIAQGWVWLRDHRVEDQVHRRRPIARVTHTADGKVRGVVYCEMIYADDNDLAAFSGDRKPDHGPAADMLVFMNSWYRERLGIRRKLDPGSVVGLTIELKDARPFSWQVYACADHPQVVVRLATWLGLLGLGLGVIGVGLGLLALGENNSFVQRVAGIGVVIAGIAELVWSTILVLTKRR